jgi:hypothetical protein
MNTEARRKLMSTIAGLRSIGRSAFALLLLALCASTAYGGITCRVEPLEDAKVAPGLPWIIIPHVANPPKIDGTLAQGEWDRAAVTREFIQAGTGKPFAYTTKAWLAVDGKRLYVGARCGLISEKEPSAVVTRRDGEVWFDDSVEFFIQPGRAEHYYQFIVNAIGTRYDGRHIFEKGLLRSVHTWNTDYQARTGREKDAWTLEMAIPLSAIELKPDGLRAVRLNICRDGASPGGTWSPLPTAMYHSPKDFGVGICTFGVPLGRRFDMAQVTGWKRLGVFRMEAKKRSVLLPGEFELTAHIALPQ